MNDLSQVLPKVLPEPNEDKTIAIRAGVSDVVWRRKVLRAIERAAFLQAVEKKFEGSDHSWRECLREVGLEMDSEVDWS